MSEYVLWHLISLVSIAFQSAAICAGLSAHGLRKTVGARLMLVGLSLMLLRRILAWVRITRSENVNYIDAVDAAVLPAIISILLSVGLITHSNYLREKRKAQEERLKHIAGMQE